MRMIPARRVLRVAVCSLVVGIAVGPALLAHGIEARRGDQTPPPAGGQPQPPAGPGPAPGGHPSEGKPSETAGGAQGTQPAKPPTPEEAVDRAVQHLKERAQRLLNPPPATNDPQADFEARLNDFACVLAILDMNGPLRRYGQITYKDDPKKLEAFNKKYAEFVKASGTDEERKDFLDKLYHMPSGPPPPPGSQPPDPLHSLYHRANGKKFTELQALGLESLYKPMKDWKVFECQGADCPLRTDTEKSIPRRPGK
jgi:hypothetical protein